MAALNRWVAGVEYRGADFRGWQVQASARTVQGELQRALSKVGDAPVELHAAGRTDAGVHAIEQVVHFDSSVVRAPGAWLLGGNALAPVDLSVRWVAPVDAAFHARHSALARRYRYRIHNLPVRSALREGFATWVRHPLDVASMHDAAQRLLGEQDFSAFRAAHCQSCTPMRFVAELSVRRDGSEVVIDIEANAFVHHMVRNIVGSLILIGLGRRPHDWLAEVLASRDRKQAGPTAAAQGLYLVGVRYPARFEVPVTSMPALPALGVWEGGIQR